MLRLKRPLRPSSNADPEDTLATKLHLADLGFYKPPTGEFHRWPDAELFAGLRKAQEFVGETPDGEMLPGGPTEAALNRLAASRPPIPQEKPNDYQRAVAMDLVRDEGAIADGETWREATERQTGYGIASVAVRSSKDYAGLSGDILVPRNSFFGGGGLGPRSLNMRPGEILPGRGHGVGGGSAAPGPPNLLEESAAVRDGRDKVDPSLMDVEGWHREALPPEKQEPMRGPSAEEIDRLNKELSKPLTGPAPAPIEVTPETFPAELPSFPQILIFPDFAGEFDEYAILEDRKGNSKTKAQLDSIRDWFLDRGWEHEKGGRNRQTGREIEEFWVPSIAKRFGGDGRLGGRFVDLTMKSPDGQIVHIQTVTLDKNGKPVAAELDAAEAIRRMTGAHVILIPKNWQRRSGRRGGRGGGK